MMNWVKTLVRGVTQGETAIDTLAKPNVSRQELSDLFADDLARPALRKRPRIVSKQPRRLIAGRMPCAA
ncbi:hypothetical protein [uncultured Tateyamaria sp.]|uniref:hypothetical protein n=1 Tax=uncultured Tateyamaria sp. TaxID=455651 RepID=UPI002620AE80|nr:hypothetical protein [uncultured Tateyamaria sp.]